MNFSSERHSRRRLITSYFSVIISISLVLFLIGIMGLIILNTSKVIDVFKEKIAISIYLKENTKSIEISLFKKTLLAEPYTKRLNYISKKVAARNLQKDLGEDFITFLGHNPLQNSIDLYLKADYVTDELLLKISEDIFSKEFVEEVDYNRGLIKMLTESSTRITYAMLIISGGFLLVAMLLINSSIRLSVYSNRFIIKTMQMVGATKRFIRRPFIYKNIKLGLYSSILSIGAIYTVIYFIDHRFHQLNLLSDYIMQSVLSGGIIILSIFITTFSTFIASQKYLNLKSDEIY